MNLLLVAAAEVQRFCHAQSWPFCFIGGLAIQRWGEARIPDAQSLARKTRVLLLTTNTTASSPAFADFNPQLQPRHLPFGIP